LAKNKAGSRFPVKNVKPDLKHICSPSQDLLLSCYTCKIQFLSPALQDMYGMVSREPVFAIHPLPAASSIRLHISTGETLIAISAENYAIVSTNVYDP